MREQLENCREDRMEIARLYRDQSGELWHGPLYCGEKTFFATVNSSDIQRSDIDPSWVETDLTSCLSLDALNKFLQLTQLDESASVEEKARQVAVQAHVNQTRWNGDAYITHPIRVAEAVAKAFPGNSVRKAISFLHDVEEDTELTFDDLRRFGFSEDIIAGVDSVTKRDGECYRDFILRSKRNNDGCAVKIADIKDNLRDLTRKSKTMRDKYELALHILEN